MIVVTSVIISALMYSTPYIFGALGGVISEKSGVVNIGIEGMMTIGAFAGAASAYFSGNPWIGFLVAGLSGSLLALLHAMASITFKADQTISGIALNFIGPGFALFLSRRFFNDSTSTLKVEKTMTKLFSGNLEMTFLIAIVCTLILSFILYRTKLGLRIRAVGEHPAAADTMGVNVYLIRYMCVIASGFLAGLGGAAVTISITSSFAPASISGQGFIALAAVIFGKWKPLGAFWACMFFGLTKAIATVLNLPIPNEILSTLPYVITIVVLIIFVGRSSAPKADGVPYVKGER